MDQLESVCHSLSEVRVGHLYRNLAPVHASPWWSMLPCPSNVLQARSERMRERIDVASHVPLPLGCVEGNARRWMVVVGGLQLSHCADEHWTNLLDRRAFGRLCVSDVVRVPFSDNSAVHTPDSDDSLLARTIFRRRKPVSMQRALVLTRPRLQIKIARSPHGTNLNLNGFRYQAQASRAPCFCLPYRSA